MQSFSLSNTDFGGLLYSVPTPVLVLVLIVLAIVVIGILSRIGTVLKGKGSALDYIGLALVLFLLALIGIIMFKTTIKGIGF